jgi:hypothetical protein
MTDLWLRYRVIKAKVRATFYPNAGTTALVGAIYPYRSNASGFDNLDAVANQTGVKYHPLNYTTGAPVIIERTFNLRQMYNLLNDNTEDGLEGPLVWAEATH